MKLLLLGGSFDPVHRGHEAIADAARAAHPNASLLWIPSGHAPHKPEREPAPAQDRLALLKLALATRPGEEIFTAELERPGPSYTVDTLETLARLHPGTDFLLLLGADSLEHLASWRDLERLFRLSGFAFAPRPGWGPGSLESFCTALTPELARDFRAEWLPMAEQAVSSTQIRRDLAAARAPQGLRPAVEAELRRRGLYGARNS